MLMFGVLADHGHHLSLAFDKHKVKPTLQRTCRDNFAKTKVLDYIFDLKEEKLGMGKINTMRTAVISSLIDQSIEQDESPTIMIIDCNFKSENVKHLLVPAS